MGRNGRSREVTAGNGSPRAHSLLCTVLCGRGPCQFRRSCSRRRSFGACFSAPNSGLFSWVWLTLRLRRVGHLGRRFVPLYRCTVVLLYLCTFVPFYRWTVEPCTGVLLTRCKMGSQRPWSRRRPLVHGTERTDGEGVRWQGIDGCSDRPRGEGSQSPEMSRGTRYWASWRVRQDKCTSGSCPSPS